MNDSYIFLAGAITYALIRVFLDYNYFSLENKYQMEKLQRDMENAKKAPYKIEPKVFFDSMSSSEINDEYLKELKKQEKNFYKKFQLMQLDKFNEQFNYDTKNPKDERFNLE